MKRTVIVGASSGIGRELAKLYAGEGDILGLTARRKPSGYVTKRWGLIAFLFKIIPRRLYIAGDIRSERARLLKE